MADISRYLEIYTQEYLFNLALGQVSDELDKRQGSIIYDTLKVVCDKMADVFMEVKEIVEQGYIISATKDINIDYRVAERGITRHAATYAERLGVFTYSGDVPANIATGAIFSTIDENKDNIVNYVVTGPYTISGTPVAGSYILQCQTAGTIGNTYFGEILAISDMDTLDTATLTTVITPARDEEENDAVKERYFETFNIEAFGGNLANYKDYMEDNFTGVGQTQIYPRTQVEHDIVLSCIDPSYQPISQEYQDTIKQTMDPENYYNNGNNTEGMGLGIVPIGHKVTVTTPTQTTINVAVEVTLTNTAYFETVRQKIITNITTYINTIQQNWADGNGEYSSVIYYNKILSAAIDAEGVANVTTCTVNESTSDITLTQSRTQQYIPSVGTITVSEG